MYITSTRKNINHGDIIRYMPRKLRSFFYSADLSDAREIRLRLGMPVCIYFGDGQYYISKNNNLTRIPTSAVRVTREDIEEAMELAAASSVYSVKNEIKNGFITLRGGHRAGITGSAVVKMGEIDFIKEISAINYRIAGEVIGAADGVIGDITGGGLKNTLIISPPAAGKTTMLRDIARQLSYMGVRVSIVDERREIAAMYEGRSPFDLGFNTDVLQGADKAEGMQMVLRSMAPQVIITDEIGTDADIRAIQKVTNSGAAVIASIHGQNLKMINRRADLRDMLSYFNLVITLSNRLGAGTVEEIIRL